MTLDQRDPYAVAAFVRSHGLAVVATTDPDAAPMNIAALDDGTVIFEPRVSSRKLQNLRSNAEVAVVAGLTGDSSIQLEQRAGHLRS